ncbi:odorant receptor 131-2-like [Syngnathus typhle]|uniref:odorant receptor 131-2-like n=1 Tax=Syngnathus typhle TaxID=161592 RepID=UPI002A6A0CFC|nr:odorant receptor 131-2-like [Syngnathus typhle]
MAGNSSLVGRVDLQAKSNFNSIINFIQVLMAVFLAINVFQLVALFSKEQFTSSTRYILFGNMLLNDCWFLLVSNLLLLFYFFDVATDLRLCLLIYFFLAISNMATACTLTAMTLERYVAVCVPLRHADLCSGRRALGAVALIGAVSSVPCAVFFTAILPSVIRRNFAEELRCSAQNLEAYPWHNYLRSAMFLLYFMVMAGVIVFCYVRITKAANAASAGDRAASRKGLGTVSLHAFQLLLCLLYLLVPMAEKAIEGQNNTLFQYIRTFNYVVLILTPRCLSPLVYGLRDEMFFKVLKSYALCRRARRESQLVGCRRGRRRGRRCWRLSET